MRDISKRDKEMLQVAETLIKAYRKGSRIAGIDSVCEKWLYWYTELRQKKSWVTKTKKKDADNR